MNSKLIASLIGVAFVSALLAEGCSKGRSADVLAEIDGKHRITVEDFYGRIANLPTRYQEFIEDNKKEFLDELIVDMLLYNEAVSQGLDKDEDVLKVFKEAKKKILIARLLKDEVGDKATVEEEEIKVYYNENRDSFSTPEVLRASHILVKTKSAAQDILVELSNGRNFEDLARARSVDPTSKNGGDIGYFTQHQLVPEFEDACRKMQVGEISDIVETKFGYHVIKLTERKEPRIKGLDEVRTNIESALLKVKKKQSFNEFVEALKEKAKITVNADLLETVAGEDREDTEG
jgi:peptidyl-prolyl cis-trans isomerase C